MINIDWKRRGNVIVRRVSHLFPDGVSVAPLPVDSPLPEPRLHRPRSRVEVVVAHLRCEGNHHFKGL